MNNKIVKLIKWLMAITAFALIVAIFAGLSLGWFKTKEEYLSPDTEIMDADNRGGMTLPEMTGEENGIALMSAEIPVEKYADYGISPLAVETAYTVTASFSADSVVYGELKWSIAWKSGASGQWGNGKTVTEYVTLQVADDNNMSATVTCLKAFGEQIILKVEAKDFENVSVTATIDYAKRVTGASYSFTGVNASAMTVPFDKISGNSDVARIGVMSNSDASVKTSNMSYTYSDTYTISEEFTYNMLFTLNTTWKSALSAYAAETNLYKTSTFVKNVIDGLGSLSGVQKFSVSASSSVDFSSLKDVFSHISTGWSSSAGSQQYSELKSFMAGFGASGGGNWRYQVFDITLTVTSEHSMSVFYGRMGFGNSSFGAVPTSGSLKLNQNAFVF